MLPKQTIGNTKPSTCATCHQKQTLFSSTMSAKHTIRNT
ncbi:unnamed protein product [Sphacelaria rigidula]